MHKTESESENESTSCVNEDMTNVRRIYVSLSRRLDVRLSRSLRQTETDTQSTSTSLGQSMSMSASGAGSRRYFNQEPHAGQALRRPTRGWRTWRGFVVVQKKDRV